MSKRHPMQPVVIASDGCARFKENRIVRDLLDLASKHGLDLNQICIKDYEPDDYAQLMELIGYSVSGYGDLDRSRRDHVRRADRDAGRLF